MMGTGQALAFSPGGLHAQGAISCNTGVTRYRAHSEARAILQASIYLQLCKVKVRPSCPFN